MNEWSSWHLAGIVSHGHSRNVQDSFAVHTSSSKLCQFYDYATSERRDKFFIQNLLCHPLIQSCQERFVSNMQTKHRQLGNWVIRADWGLTFTSWCRTRVLAILLTSEGAVTNESESSRAAIGDDCAHDILAWHTTRCKRPRGHLLRSAACYC